MTDAGRAVLSDDGSTIRLTAYGDDGAIVAVTLAPVRAIALASELIRAALPKLASVTEDNSTTAISKRRGGDSRAEQRRQLHEGLRGMASLLGLGKGKPAAEVAREITDRCKRYQPMSVETDPLRREMLRVRSTGLPIPASERHMIRVISDIQ